MITGYDIGPVDYLDEEIELTEAHTIEQAELRRAHHDVMGKMHQYAASQHEGEAIRHMGVRPHLEKFHAAEAHKHWEKSAKHDNAWEKAHTLVSKLKGF